MKNLDKASVSHNESLVRELRDDPELAAEYLQAAMADEEEPAVLLLALRHVVEAYGMPKVAEHAGIQRESLYRALSPKGNPTLRTLTAVLKAVGLRLSVTPDRHSPLYSPDHLVEPGRWQVKTSPKVVAVESCEPPVLVLSFTNGERRRFDLSPYLDKGIFKELRNPSYFRAVRAVSGFVEWPHGQDLSWDTLYLKSTPISLASHDGNADGTQA